MGSLDQAIPVEGGKPTGQSRPPSKKKWAALLPASLTVHQLGEDSQRNQAELFYLQKQIQMQTPMAIVMEDGEKIEGRIEWYDRHVLKVSGRSRILIYKAAIKYIYKLNEAEGFGNRE
jgi:sRNA-binding regulator protein Hfq